MARTYPSGTGPQLTPLGRALVFLFIVGCIVGATLLFMGRRPSNISWSWGQSLFARKPDVEIGIAYGAEKQGWLDWAITEFGKTAEGRKIKINLIPMGSLESAHALLNGDSRINVWLPGSSAYKDVFVQEWRSKYDSDPILREEPLALTPMAFVIWDDRYEAFIQKYKNVSFDTVSQALAAEGGWDEIAHRAEWGAFKFGSAQPNQSNSGLQSLILAAYAYRHKIRNLTIKDVEDPGFQKFLGEFQQGASGMPSRTGTLMHDMILTGPSAYDAIIVYENLAIESLANAEGRWGKLRVVYPQYNSWNENPYYIVNAPWSTTGQRKAADAFLNFLLSQPVQQESLKHGFRPANPVVPVKSADSPFMQYAANGVSVDLPRMCEPAKADVVRALLASWDRAQGSR